MTKCKICENEQNNTIYKVRERQIQKNGDIAEEFNYLYCGKCGTLQLIDNIEHMEKYYPPFYYSFVDTTDKRSPSFLRKLFMIYNVTFGFPSILQYKLLRQLAPYMYLSKTGIKFNAKILDVGCGNGRWLRLLHGCGYKNLYGIDLFCNDSTVSGINYKQTDIFDLSLGQFDLITFHHSFEHMKNPEKVLKRVRELLSPKKGTCIIRIPVMECEAWNRYGTNWYQIDAPRHTFLYTKRSLNTLCEKAGLIIENIIYDSDPSQFVFSQYYKNTNLCLKDISENVNSSDFKKYSKLTEHVNRNGRGDQAIFYLKVR